MNTRLLSVLLLLAMGLLLLGGCNNSYHTRFVHVEDNPEEIRLAAVLPLVNLTAHPHAGRAVGDLLYTELYGLSRFDFLEPTAMLERLKGGEPDLDYVLDSAVAREVGRKLGVDVVIYGSVGEYRYKLGLDQSPAVGMNLRMLDVRSGEVLWAASISKTGGCFFVCDDSLNRIAQEAVHEAVTGLSAQ